VSQREIERERQIREQICEKGSQRSEVCVLCLCGDSEREKGRKKLCVCLREIEREFRWEERGFR
jgi:hypothetical protein